MTTKVRIQEGTPDPEGSPYYVGSDGEDSTVISLPTVESILVDHASTVKSVVDSVVEDPQSRFVSGMFELFVVETVFLRSVGDMMEQYSRQVSIPTDEAGRWAELKQMWEALHSTMYRPEETSPVEMRGG